MAQNLQIIKNGEDISGKGIKASNQILKDQLPDLTMELLSNIVILGQGLPFRFSNNTPSGRKEVLEKLFKADFMIEDIKVRINNRLSVLKEEQRNIEDTILSINSKLDVIRDSLSKSESELQDMLTPGNSEFIVCDTINPQEKLRQEIKQDTERLNIVKQELQQKKNENEKIVETNNEISNKIVELSNKKIEINNTDYLNDEIEEITNKGLELKNDVILLDKEIQQKDSITDICPTCGQKLQGVEKPDTTKDKARSMQMKAELDKLRIELRELKQKRADKINSELVQIDAQIGKLNSSKKQLIDTRNLDNEINELTNRIHINQNKVDIFESKKKELEINIKNYELQIKENESNRDKLINDKIKLDGKIEVDNKINTVIKRDFRGYLLSNIISLLNSTCKEYAKEVFGHDNLEISQDGNNISITFNNKEYEVLSGGEKQKVDVIIQLAIRQVLMKYTSINANIISMDEIFDNLDDTGSENILNLLTNIISVPSIYIISHHSEIPIPYDSQIIVKKNNKGSTAIQL